MRLFRESLLITWGKNQWDPHIITNGFIVIMALAVFVKLLLDIAWHTGFKWKCDTVYHLHWWRLVCEASFLPQNCRSSRPEVFCEKGVLRNLAKLTGKHLCQSLFFNKAAGKRLCQKCLPVNFAKFLGTSFLKEHLMWQLMHLISCQSILSSFLAFFPIIAVQEDDTLHTNNNNHRNLLGLFHNSLINWLVGMGKWINCRNYCI